MNHYTIVPLYQCTIIPLYHCPLFLSSDFSDGVLGLAWVAQPPGGSSGGICEGRVRLSIGERSLNTAIASYLNYGARQPRGVVTITVAHEFGHNFGSPVN